MPGVFRKEVPDVLKSRLVGIVFVGFAGNWFDGDELGVVRGGVGELLRNVYALDRWLAGEWVVASEGVLSMLLACGDHGNNYAVNETDEAGVVVERSVEPL